MPCGLPADGEDCLVTRAIFKLAKNDLVEASLPSLPSVNRFLPGVRGGRTMRGARAKIMLAPLRMQTRARICFHLHLA